MFLQELAWREFYAHVLWHHPRVLREPFQAAFAASRWADDDDGFDAWARAGPATRSWTPPCASSGRRASMHNRARMIAASFLTKDLLLDWRLGEAEFMRHLTDGDVASNNGGWQWTASTGTDPQPYFRIFNPVLQGKRFDPTVTTSGAGSRSWRTCRRTRIHEPWTMTTGEQAEAGCRIGTDYPAPIVDHAAARERALAAFAAAKERAG